MFGIQTGVAISFMVRRAKQKGCRICYARRLEMETAEEKLAFLGKVKIGEVEFEEVRPDAKNKRTNLTANGFYALIPIATNEAKSRAKNADDRAMFRSYSFGVVTNRDDWVYADSPPVVRTDIPDEKARRAGVAPKAMLKADKEGGRIVLDSETTLAGVPAQAWVYRLGNRCALERILDRYKSKAPKDPTIREKFNTYQFADYRENVIELLRRADAQGRGNSLRSARPPAGRVLDGGPFPWKY